MTTNKRTLAFALTGLLSVAMIEGARAQSIGHSFLASHCQEQAQQFRDEHAQLRAEVEALGSDYHRRQVQLLTEFSESMTNEERMAIVLHQELASGNHGYSAEEVASIRRRIPGILNRIESRFATHLDTSRAFAGVGNCYDNVLTFTLIYPQLVQTHGLPAKDEDRTLFGNRIQGGSQNHCSYQNGSITLTPARITNGIINARQGTATVCTYASRIDGENFTHLTGHHTALEIRMCSTLDLLSVNPVRISPQSLDASDDAPVSESHTLWNALGHELAIQGYRNQTGATDMPIYLANQAEYVFLKLSALGEASTCRQFLPEIQGMSIPAATSTRTHQEVLADAPAAQPQYNTTLSSQGSRTLSPSEMRAEKGEGSEAKDAPAFVPTSQQFN